MECNKIVCSNCGGEEIEKTSIGTIVGQHDPNRVTCLKCGKKGIAEDWKNGNK
jgi:ribosomal protein S27AE